MQNTKYKTLSLREYATLTPPQREMYSTLSGKNYQPIKNDVKSSGDELFKATLELFKMGIFLSKSSNEF